VLIFRYSEHDRRQLARRFPTERAIVLPDGTILDIHGVDGINAHLPDCTLHAVELETRALDR
jgi:hypothetical protein